jgi:hypothetical protein
VPLGQHFRPLAKVHVASVRGIFGEQTRLANASPLDIKPRHWESDLLRVRTSPVSLHFISGFRVKNVKKLTRTRERPTAFP